MAAHSGGAHERRIPSGRYRGSVRDYDGHAHHRHDAAQLYHHRRAFGYARGLLGRIVVLCGLDALAGVGPCFVYLWFIALGMTYAELKNATADFNPAIAADHVFPRTLRERLLAAFSVLCFITGAVGLLSVFPALMHVLVSVYPAAASITTAVGGVFFIMLPFLLLIFMVHTFVNAYYFRGFDHVHVLGERLPTAGLRVSFEVALFCFGANESDLTDSFIRFSYGGLMFLRAGLTAQDLGGFLQNRTGRLDPAQFSVTPSDPDALRVFDLALAIYREDKELSDFLFAHGVQEKNFVEAAQWVSRDMLTYKKRARWWSRDNLGRVEGIAKDWSYGTAYRLRRYAYDLTKDRLSPLSTKPKYIRDEVERIEAALSKRKEANALIVGEDGGSKMEVLRGFTSAIQEGTIFPALEHKKVYLFDANRLISDTGEKTRFEHELIRLLDEAAASGNVIMAIVDFPALMESASKLGSGVVGLLSPYLDSAALQFICLASPMPFHQVIETDGTLSAKFDTIILAEGESLDILQTLQDEASDIEARYRLSISQPVLSLVAESADRYVTEGMMPDKAIDLLNEIAAKAVQEGKRILTREEVLSFVKAKTGIPTGSVTSEEKQKLVKLEELLHQRVIGQDEAVNAIANAMRRSRAGVGNPNRPMGSFLFMGPTGVGKTETTKALAQAFFGDENRILRLDMSEYTSADALSKLIGSFQTNTPGVLTSLLREKPYGVLLLDEFEKTTREVMDLFLQVLDEGMFSDMHGKRVNARNLIIIATSNAGSEMIFEYLKRGEDIAQKRNEIIEAVIAQGIFRPEFLNRFDGVILFHPIDVERLREVARLMLERFRSRIRARGIDLEVTDDLVNYLMKFGSDPKFGARPMNRAIQDIVEQKIADKIIKGEIMPGQKIRLTETDLT